MDCVDYRCSHQTEIYEASELDWRLRHRLCRGRGRGDFYRPVIELMGVSQSWDVVVAILLALSAENLMKVLVELSSDKEWIKTMITTKVEK